jgi:sugar lactone lactonase YvrE
MKKLFVAVTIACLGTILASISAQAGGLAFDPAGNLYVADSSRHSVLKYAPDGTKSSFAAELKYPLGLCLDGKGNLFVSDGAANTARSQRSIFKFGPNGTKSTFVSGISSFGMACDRSGNLFVADNVGQAEKNSIFRFTPDGAKSTFVSGIGNPGDLAFDGAGNLFVVDFPVMAGSSGPILKFSPDGTKTTFATGLHGPSALAIDATGNVYVVEVTAADASSHAILKFSPGGTKSAFTSALGAGWDWGLAVDGSGNVFAWNGHAILKIDSNGTPSTFASDWVSPDKQWEYRLVDGNSPEVKFPEIVKAGTTQVVLDLHKELEVSSPEGLFWAPNSKRFAFNYYSPPHARHTTYETVAFYQLREEKWIKLRPPVDRSSYRSQLMQLAKEHLSKRAYPRDGQPFRDILQMREWTDANTAILYASSVWEESGLREPEAAFLFTLTFDEAGNWKIIKTHQMSKKELEEGQ